MKRLYTVSVLSIAFLMGGCGSSDNDTKLDNLRELQGMWSTNTVPVSGFGYYNGLSTHKYGEDGTYRTDVEFTDLNSGCYVKLYYVGTYTANDKTLQVNPTRGEVEVSLCNDNSLNAPKRTYTEEEFAKATTSIEWEVQEDLLVLKHEDGMDRNYQRQEDVFADLYGTWSTNKVAVSGYGNFDGTATHTFKVDGSYRWDIEFTDPNSGCHAVLYYAGEFTGNATTLQSSATDGEKEVDLCTDNSLNVAKHKYNNDELESASSSISWTVIDDKLIFLHADGLERIYKSK